LQIILELRLRCRLSMTLLDSKDCSESNLHIAPVIVTICFTCFTSQVIVTWNGVLRAPLYYCEETVMTLVFVMPLHI
jgi:hypothetical protein